MQEIFIWHIYIFYGAKICLKIEKLFFLEYASK